MKFLTYILLALLAAGCQASVPLKWTVESSHAEPVYFNVYRGETLELEATFNSYGRPLTNGLNAAQIFWQTNGMESAWWYDDATVDGNRIRATFTPEMYPDATTVRVFLGVTNSIYRADATLRIRHSPANPNHLYPPIPVLDFNQVEVHNAPWQRPLTAGDNIVITNDVISALGGGGGVTPDDLAAVAQAATNYTDNAAQAATNYTDNAAQAATNYTDAAVSGLPTADDLAAAAQAATNYTDNAAQAATNYTDAAVSGLPTATDLAAVAQAATNYTDNAAQAATNYTDAAVAGLPTADDLAAVAQAATNYTDAATQGIVRLDGGSVILKNVDDNSTGLILLQSNETNQTDYGMGVIRVTSPDFDYFGEHHTGAAHEYHFDQVWDGDVYDSVATKRESYQRVNDKDGGSTALVLQDNNPQYGGPYGAYSISGDEASRAGGYGSVALGYHTTAIGDYSFAYGRESVALKEGAIALGYQCFNQATNAFGWSAAGAYNLSAARSGTFNIDPIGGTSGFYIGNTNLATLLSQSSGTTEDRVREIIVEEGSVKTNADGVATFTTTDSNRYDYVSTKIDNQGVTIKDDYWDYSIELYNYGLFKQDDDEDEKDGIDIVNWCLRFDGRQLFLPTGAGYTNQLIQVATTNWVCEELADYATREWTDKKISGNYLPINKVSSDATTNLFIRFGSRDSSAFANVGSYSATFGQGHVAKGARAFAANADNLAYGNDSAAFGGRNVTTNTYAFVVGESNNAGGRASFVAGGRAKTEQGHAYAFAWNGNTNVVYSSQAKGTFNINPIGGASGFYIGSTNLATLLSQSSGVTESRVHEIVTNDVPLWARATTKPSYTYAEIGGTFPGVTTETDPTIKAWAKADNKPSYTYAEIGGTFPGMTDVSCTVRGISAVKNTSNNRLEISKAPIETIVTTNTAFAFYDGMSVRKFTGSVLNVDTTIANWPDGESCFVILDLPTTAVTAPTKLHVIGSDNVLTGRMQTAMWRVGNDFYLNVISRAGANDYLVTDKELGR